MTRHTSMDPALAAKTLDRGVDGLGLFDAVAAYRAEVRALDAAPEKPRFNGPDYTQAHDHARLTDQLNRIKTLMGDGQWRTLSEITDATGDPEASVSAQLRHLRKPRFGSFNVEKRRRGDPTRGWYEYRVAP